MYICLDCENVFDEANETKYYDKVDGNSAMSGYVTEYSCPSCGSEYFEEAVECEFCGEWTVTEDLHEGICENCISEKATVEIAVKYGETEKQTIELNGLLAYAFSDEQINEILLRELKEAARIYPQKIKAEIIEFYGCDMEAFAKWAGNL